MYLLKFRVWICKNNGKCMMKLFHYKRFRLEEKLYVYLIGDECLLNRC